MLASIFNAYYSKTRHGRYALAKRLRAAREHTEINASGDRPFIAGKAASSCLYSSFTGASTLRTSLLEWNDFRNLQYSSLAA